MSCGHTHENPLAQLACDEVQDLNGLTGCAACVAIVGPGRTETSFVGNVTAGALIVEALVELIAADSPRPTSCIVCMANYDRLLRVREIMAQPVGRC